MENTKLINVYEILKNAPRKYNLYSHVLGGEISYGKWYLSENGNTIVIHSKSISFKGSRQSISFLLNEYGYLCDDGQCVIYPSPIHTWEDWQPEFFIEGDIVKHVVTGKLYMLVEKYNRDYKVLVEYSDGKREKLNMLDFVFASSKEISEFNLNFNNAHQNKVEIKNSPVDLSDNTIKIGISDHVEDTDVTTQIDDVLEKLNNGTFMEDFNKWQNDEYERKEEERQERENAYIQSFVPTNTSYHELVSSFLKIGKELANINNRINEKQDKTVILGGSSL